MKKDITLFGLLVCFYLFVITLLFIGKPKEIGEYHMAGHLDDALLQMAGFAPEGNLYAKAADKWTGNETNGYLGKTGHKFEIEKDVHNDAANWGFKDADARLNALLYAWAKDNPNAEITPEVISRLRSLAGTADSMNVTGGWLTDRVYEDPHVTGLLNLIKKDPVKANNIFKAKGYNSDSAIQNYFDWASQYMDKSTNSNSFWRNIDGREFNEGVKIGSRELEDELNTAINNPNYGMSATAKKMMIAAKKGKSALAEAEAMRKEEEKRRKNLERAGFGFEFDPEFKNDKSIPDEWL